MIAKIKIAIIADGCGEEGVGHGFRWNFGDSYELV